MAVTILGVAVSIGWVIGGTLLLAMTVLMLIISREVRLAPEMPDHLAEDEWSRHPSEQTLSLRQRTRRNEIPNHRHVSLNRPGMASESYKRVMPRRVRARQNRPRISSWS